MAVLKKIMNIAVAGDEVNRSKISYLFRYYISFSEIIMDENLYRFSDTALSFQE